jgi:hypothetical protein
VTVLKQALDASRAAARPARRRNQREHAFQGTLYKYLEFALPDEAIVTSIDHANAASAVTGAMRRERGVLDGIPDTLITWQPDKSRRLQVVVWFETKSPTGRLKGNQEIWRDALLRRGHFWAMPRTLEDAVCVLDEAQIPLKARPS